ncbi:MAG: DUF262 domain-containing protein [Dehalococcoidia bacterium]
MPGPSFKTNPVSLESLLSDCATGEIQLPDFQRSWVWGDDRIRSLIASVSRGFPIGALMTLAASADAPAAFASRPVEGAPHKAEAAKPDQLLLDGQQRMTSLYQACMRREVVSTITAKNKLVKRWFYISIEAALQHGSDREQCIVLVPEDRRIKTNFDKDIVLDLSTPDREYDAMMFPLNRVFDWDEWQDGFGDYWIGKGEPDRRKLFRAFKEEVLQHFKGYQVPVISLERDTPNEAVCLVFEKVNTGGKPLDAFELLTAMYAAQGHPLREDWLGNGTTPGIQARLVAFGRSAGQKAGVLEKIASTDFLQTVALLHAVRNREEKAGAGAKEGDLPAIRATRQSLLDLPLKSYLDFRDAAEQGYQRVAKFLRREHIYRVLDLPYQSQMIPLAAIFATLGEKSDHADAQSKVARWFWCGIFGELYGGSTESRFARDILEVPAWINGGELPSTVSDGVFRADRLFSMRSRASAAYKGIHALLMRQGAKDFRTGQAFDDTVFFEEDVDVHHIFPKAWCQKKGIPEKVYDVVVNKTPLPYKTNRMIGGDAPSTYLTRLEEGRKDQHGAVIDPPIDRTTLDGFLTSHAIPAELLHADDFDGFMKSRRDSLLELISAATGHAVFDVPESPDDGEDLPAELALDIETEMELAS